MKTQIYNIKQVGSGHWKVTCYRFNYSKKHSFITSTTYWTNVTTDSMLIDAYKSGSNSAEKRLIQQTMRCGDKTMEK